MSQFRNPEINHLEGELAFRHAQRLAMDADKTKHDSKTGQFTSGGGGAAAGSNHHEVLSGHGWTKDKHSQYIMDKNGDRYVHKDHPGHHISAYTRDAGPSTHKGDWRHDTTTHEGNNETGLSITDTVAKGSGHKSLAEHLAEFHGTKKNT